MDHRTAFHRISPSNFTLDLETTCEFFVGNLNKQKTRDEIFQDLTNIKIDCLNENLYISKFNMPKFNARKDANGHLLLNLGYAFVTAKKPEMAAEMIKRKRVQLTDGSDIEIKAVCRTKRMTANANCKNKNAERFSQTVGEGRGMNSRNFSSNYQNDSSRYSPRTQNNYNREDRNDQYYNSNSIKSNRRCYQGDFSNYGTLNDQRFDNPVLKNSVFDNNNNVNSFGFPSKNLFCAPASLNVSQNSSSGQLWSPYEEQSVKQTTPVLQTSDSQKSIFDVVASASSDDDMFSENLVCEKLYNSSPNSDKIASFETREKLWSNQSRS